MLQKFKGMSHIKEYKKLCNTRKSWDQSIACILGLVHCLCTNKIRLKLFCHAGIVIESWGVWYCGKCLLVYFRSVAKYLHAGDDFTYTDLVVHHRLYCILQ